MRTICLLALVIVVSSACDDAARITSPTSPGPTTPSSPTLHTLTGTVTEMTSSGPMPLEGAVVRDLGSGQESTTDGSGVYALSGLPATTRAVLASKVSYASISRTVALTADARLDFELGRIITHTLSGVVFEMTPGGRLPVAGVTLYCDGCGSPVGHTYTESDANGQYRFEWSPNGSTPLWVSKAGYALAGNQPLGTMPGYIVPTVEGDTRFDIELVRR